jgi:putative transposase
VVDPADRQIMAPVAAALLAADADLIARQMAQLRAIRSYRRVPAAALRRSCRRNVVRVAEMLCGRGDLPADISEDEHASGRQRAMQGIPAEDVVAAYRAVMGVLRDAVVEHASALDVPMEATLRALCRLWELTDDLSTELVGARRDIDVEIARREEQERLTFLARALTGSLPTHDLAAVAAVHGLKPGVDYWVLRARTAAPEPLEALNRSGGVVGPVDGDIAGIVATPPTLVDLDGVASIAGPVHLNGLTQAFAEATRLLNVAVRFRRRGLVDRSSLSIRVAVVEEDELGDALVARHLSPVLAAAPALLDTVEAFLACDANIARGAVALSVHQNTLRQRLDRFEQLSGADLGSLETTFEVWWALQYWSLHR